MYPKSLILIIRIWYVPYAYVYTVRVWYVPYAYHTRTVQNTHMAGADPEFGKRGGHLSQKQLKTKKTY